MKNKRNVVICGLAFFILWGCSLQRHQKYPMPYLNSIAESKSFTDSLQQNGTNKILVYHKKHGDYLRNYYIFWVDKELELRLINDKGIFKPNSWEMTGFYQNEKLFHFYESKKNDLHKDSIPEGNISHYPYVDITMIANGLTEEFHLPSGTSSVENSTPYHFARLIESTLYNIEQGSYWEQAEKKMRYFPKKYDPTKEKWQYWKREQMKEGKLWDDYYH